VSICFHHHVRERQYSVSPSGTPGFSLFRLPVVEHALLWPGVDLYSISCVYRDIPAMGKASTVRSGWLVECGCFEVEVWRGLPSVEQRAAACDGARIAVAVAEDETDQTRRGGSSLHGHESEGDW